MGENLIVSSPSPLARCFIFMGIDTALFRRLRSLYELVSSTLTCVGVVGAAVLLAFLLLAVAWPAVPGGMWPSSRRRSLPTVSFSVKS